MINFFKRQPREQNSCLPTWMHSVLRTAGIYNIVAGIAMMTLAPQGFKLLGIARTEFMMPIQLVGVLVAVFGVGYLMVDRNPHENRNVLYLGFMSKLLGPFISLIYIANGMLPISFLLVLFFADTIYLYPFWKIYHRLDEVRRGAQPATIMFPSNESDETNQRRRAA